MAENIMGKWWLPTFRPSPTIFSPVVFFFLLGLQNSGLCGTCLTHYQTTNFTLFQIERLCRRQLKIWRKWQKVIQTGRKHCGKRRNCSLRAISPFSTVFSKGSFPRGIKRCHCVGMGEEYYLWLIVWGLMSFSSLFQLYCSSQCTYPCLHAILFTSTLHNILSKPLAAFLRKHCRNNGQPWERINPFISPIKIRHDTVNRSDSNYRQYYPV